MDYNTKQMGRLWYLTWRMRHLCGEKGWTSSDLARYAHVKPRRIRKIEKAMFIRQVDMDILYRIADALEVPVAELLKG
ncbi:MAG: helix-turn-helix transcriptional regulator [Clostridiales bacterium]|jgi:transcriptional regulator with XRE-family HTH domain|nr:helix-turn-helix transcriptional regulator [Clostridiales bacterium]